MSPAREPGFLMQTPTEGQPSSLEVLLHASYSLVKALTRVGRFNTFPQAPPLGVQ